MKHRNKIVPLHFHRGFLWNKKGSLDFLNWRGDFGEEARAQHAIGIWEDRRDLYGASGDIDLAIEEVELAEFGVAGAICKLKREAGFFFLLRLTLNALEQLNCAEVFGLGDEEIHFHRINLRGLGETAHASTGADKVTDLRLGKAGDTIERRADRAVVQIHLRGLHGGLGGGNIGQRGLGVLVGCLVFLLTDDLGLVELGLLLQRELLELGLGNRTCVIGLSLREGGLEWSRVDGEKDVAFFDCGAFLVVLGQKIAGDLCLDVRILKPIEKADPLIAHNDITLDDWRHGHFDRRGLNGGTFFTGDKKTCGRKKNHDVNSELHAHTA